MLGLQLGAERRRHDLAADRGRRGEVRLARLAPARANRGGVLHGGLSVLTTRRASHLKEGCRYARMRLLALVKSRREFASFDALFLWAPLISYGFQFEYVPPQGTHGYSLSNSCVPTAALISLLTHIVLDLPQAVGIPVPRARPWRRHAETDEDEPVHALAKAGSPARPCRTRERGEFRGVARPPDACFGEFALPPRVVDLTESTTLSPRLPRRRSRSRG